MNCTHPDNKDHTSENYPYCFNKAFMPTSGTAHDHHKCQKCHVAISWGQMEYRVLIHGRWQGEYAHITCPQKSKWQKEDGKDVTI